jgi:radical SAM protein with 4Fe4S-binding SPASM domain
LHDRVRGEGVFRKVTSAIRELSKYKKWKGKTRPHIYANVIINSSLAGHVKETINQLMEATDEGIEFFRLHHLWYITPSELAAHQRIMKKALNCNAPGASSHVIPISAIIDPTAIAEELSFLRNRSNIKMFPNLEFIDIITYYSNICSDKTRCVSPFFNALIKPNGDVKFCPDEWIDDYVLGNIRKDSFDDIWNNQKARRFRAQLWKRKSFPGCKRCNGMFSFGQI